MLCISNMMWEGDFANTVVGLMRVFARKNTILYVENPFTIKDFIDGLLGRRKIPFKKLLGLQSRLKTVRLEDGATVQVLTLPLTFSINFLPDVWLYRWLLRLNGQIIVRSIRKHLKLLNMEKDLINITAFNPAIGCVTGGKFNEKLLIYHCYDMIEAAMWMKKHGPRHEREFMRMADATIVTSQGLLEKKRKFCNVCLLVKNAADVDLFQRAFPQKPSNGKIVGYIGSVDHRLDYDLLEYVITRTPHITYTFIGRLVDKKGKASLLKKANVRMEGPKSLAELPAYVRDFSLGLIPFVRDRFTQGIYPLKINEYLAAGLPVISTDFGYLDDFEGVIGIAKTREEFLSFMLKELESDTMEKKEQRHAFASSNSWDNRVEQFSEFIQTLEKQPKANG